MSRTAINAEYIRLDNLTFPGACSITFWAKSPTNSNPACMVFGQFGDFAIRRDTNGDWTWQRPYTNAPQGVARWRWTAAAVGVDVEQWHHYVFLHNGTLDAPMMYVDGIAKPFTVDIAPAGVLAQGIIADAPVYLLNNGSGNEPFDGTGVTGGMSRFGIYYGTFLQSTVLRMFTEGRYPMTDMVTFLPLDNNTPARDAYTGARGAIVDTSRPGAGDPVPMLRYWYTPTSVAPIIREQSIDLTWESIPGAAKYTVIKRIPDTSSIQEYETTTPQYRLEGLEPSTTYDIELVTWSAAQRGMPGQIFQITTLTAGTASLEVPVAWDAQPLQLVLRESITGAVVYDFSRDVSELVIEDDEHGCAAITATVPMLLDDALPLVATSLGMHVSAVVNGDVVGIGRVEQPGVSDTRNGGAFTFTAFGYQQAFDDIPYNATFAARPTRDVAAELLSIVRSLNPSQIARTPSLLQTVFLPLYGVFAQVAGDYKDESMRKVLDDIAAIMKGYTGVSWSWLVGHDQKLRVQPTGYEARRWYVEIGEYDAERVLKNLYNEVYARWTDDQNNEYVTPVIRGVVERIVRRYALQSDAKITPQAILTRDAKLRELNNPLPQVSVKIDRIVDRMGAPVPLYECRANDVITITDFAPTLSTSVDRFRTFRIVHRRYMPLVERVELTLESPRPSLDWMLARRQG